MNIKKFRECGGRAYLLALGGLYNSPVSAEEATARGLSVSVIRLTINPAPRQGATIEVPILSEGMQAIERWDDNVVCDVTGPKFAAFRSRLGDLVENLTAVREGKAPVRPYTPPCRDLTKIDRALWERVAPSALGVIVAESKEFSSLRGIETLTEQELVDFEAAVVAALASTPLPRARGERSVITNRVELRWGPMTPLGFRVK